ncbi:MAG TPA: GNAT family N-acetyltransferase [Thermoanaerobaculia bacterium]|nr:GNAT family N-acetyltransferase [Thermoanaerobaculia bacterium]
MQYEVSTDKSQLDIDLIHEFLSNDSYWAKNVPRELVERSIANSLCFGAYQGRQQVGFARVISDLAVFAYVADVFVIPAHRGRGVSKLIMQAIREHPDLQVLRRWHLLTRDAHDLYRQYGFRDLENPARHMEIAVKDPYGAAGMGSRKNC